MARIVSPRLVSRRRKYPTNPRARDAGALYPTLDLHGLTADDAVARTSRWLLDRQREGELAVRIVTGRGRRSIGPAVLPGEISYLLGSLSALVASYEKVSAGGAFHVRLRSPGLPPRRTTPVVLPSDPALIRRAEESLADLGIAPTPSLLAAEIQRIRDQDEGRQRV